MGKIIRPALLANNKALQNLRVLLTEEDTLLLLLEGLSVNEAAIRKGRAPTCIKAHIHSLKKKLGVKNLVSLGARATELGLSLAKPTQVGLPTGLTQIQHCKL